MFANIFIILRPILHQYPCHTYLRSSILKENLRHTNEEK